MLLPTSLSRRRSRRIFTATSDSRPIALDAADGRRCEGFGDGGEVDLKTGVGDFRWPGEYQVSSPPAILGDVVVVGSAVSDNGRIKTRRAVWSAATTPSTPMTSRLRSDSRQFVVIGAGGRARAGTTLGDSMVAFALPQRES